MPSQRSGASASPKELISSMGGPKHLQEVERQATDEANCREVAKPFKEAFQTGKRRRHWKSQKTFARYLDIHPQVAKRMLSGIPKHMSNIKFGVISRSAQKLGIKLEVGVCNAQAVEQDVMEQVVLRTREERSRLGENIPIYRPRMGNPVTTWDLVNAIRVATHDDLRERAQFNPWVDSQTEAISQQFPGLNRQNLRWQVVHVGDWLYCREFLSCFVNTVFQKAQNSQRDGTVSLSRRQQYQDFIFHLVMLNELVVTLWITDKEGNRVDYRAIGEVEGLLLLEKGEVSSFLETIGLQVDLLTDRDATLGRLIMHSGLLEPTATLLLG